MKILIAIKPLCLIKTSLKTRLDFVKTILDAGRKGFFHICWLFVGYVLEDTPGNLSLVQSSSKTLMHPTTYFLFDSPTAAIFHASWGPSRKKSGDRSQECCVVNFQISPAARKLLPATKMMMMERGREGDGERQ